MSNIFVGNLESGSIKADLPGSVFFLQAPSLDLRSFTSRIATYDNVSVVMRDAIISNGEEANMTLGERPAGCKSCKSISPQKLFGVPIEVTENQMWHLSPQRPFPSLHQCGTMRVLVKSTCCFCLISVARNETSTPPVNRSSTFQNLGQAISDTFLRQQTHDGDRSPEVSDTLSHCFPDHAEISNQQVSHFAECADSRASVRD